MFGLEKKEKKLFEFDLEIDLKKDSEKKKKLLQEIVTHTQSLKGALRLGAATEDFDKLGILLHGYAALQKVVNRINVKK